MVEVASEFTSLARKFLKAGGIEVIASNEVIAENSDPEAAGAFVLDVLGRSKSDLVVTVGSTATLALSRLRGTTNNHGLPPHLAIAITRSMANRVIDEMSSVDLAPEVAGITFSLTQQERLETLVAALGARRILFFAGKGVLTDRLAYDEMCEAAKALDVEIGLVTLEAKDITTALFDGYDAVVGWYFLQLEIARILRFATVPVFGGGAIDARAGASLSLADDELVLASCAVEKIVGPHFLQHRALAEIGLMSPQEADPAYAPKLFASRRSLRAMKIKLPPRFRRVAHFYP
ncbi:MAG: hypothetical protein QNJ13_13860 [Paracoccaceae bacterium]|nr:hypothetical protein [Paracoccaceae bacterium]